ncbi:MAG TPA: hypothetical protein VIT91_16410 [Chthoniobacterales bacterium]
MKYLIPISFILTAVIAFADDSTKRFIQFDEADVTAQALKYLNTVKPNMNTQNLEFEGFDVHYRQATKETALRVSFKVLDSKTEVVEDGRNCIRYQLVLLHFHPFCSQSHR